MFPSSITIACLFLANSYFIINILAQPHITILGCVICDVCYATTFSNHTYFLPGVDVNVECRVKARSGRSGAEISLSVNRTTDRYGVYKVEVDGANDLTTIELLCKATLIGGPSPSAACNIKSSSSTREVRVRSKQSNGYTYTLGALTYRPTRRNATLCSSDYPDAWNTIKYKSYLPPPYDQLPFPPFPFFPFPPNMPPSFPFPPFPSFPFPATPPSLPFPFPSVPPPPPLPSPSPFFNFWDPNTWIPHPPTP